MFNKFKFLNGLVALCALFSMVFTIKSAPLLAMPIDQDKEHGADDIQMQHTSTNTGIKSSGYVNRQTTPEYVPGEIVVKFAPGTVASSGRYLTSKRAVQLGIASIDALNRTYQVTTIERVFPNAELPAPNARIHIDGEVQLAPDLSTIYRLQLQPDADVMAIAQEYAANPNVLYAEPNYIAELDVTPDDTYYNQQWGLTQIQAPTAWNSQTGSLGIVVAIIDTGIDLNHPDLDDKIWINPGETLDGADNDGNGLIDDIHGWDWVNGDDDPQDDNGHGTHCAGIAAAETNNAQGVAGVCWGCSVMPLKAFQSSGRGSYADIAAAVTYAANKGAHVINMSFGSYADSQVLKDALENAYGTAVLVASAGNDNSLLEHYPAAYPWVMGVAATDSSDVKAGFSNYGDWVDVSAPGVNIYSTLFDDTYAGWSGTSMAAPFVSGLAALLVAEHPTWSKELIRGQLYQSTDNIDALNPLYAGQLGTGRINAGTAFSLVPTPNIQYQSNTVGDGTGDGDGVVDAGEAVTLTVILKNYWGDAANVTATLSTLDSWVTISDDTTSFGNISAYASMDNQSNPFEFSVDSNTPNNHDITFELDIYADDGYHGTGSFYLTVQRGTEVGGIIDTNTTWTSDKLYIVTDNILVNTGVTLTIQAGTHILFDAGTSLSVKGKLLAIGVPDNPILFTQSWKNIILESSESIIRFSIIEHISSVNHSGIKISDSSPEISNNIFRFVNHSDTFEEHCAMLISGSDGTILRNNLFYRNRGFYGIVCPESSTSIEYNTFYGNYQGWGASDKHAAIQIWSRNSQIVYNTFIANQKYDLADYSGPTGGVITTTQNYFGTTNSQQISERIYDFYDNTFAN